MIDLNSPLVAQELKRIIDSQVERRLRELAPRYAYGTVATIDTAAKKCSVYLYGEGAATVGVRYENPIVPAVGARVRVVTLGGDRYIDGVYGDASFVGAGSPGMPLGFIAVGTTTSIITTSSSTPVSLLAVTPTLAANRRLRVTYRSYRLVLSVAGDGYRMYMKLGSTEFYSKSMSRGSTTANEGTELIGYVTTGAGGSLTIEAFAVRTAGTGTLSVRATATDGEFAFLLVEDMGPA